VQWHPEVDEALFRGWLVDGNADPALAEETLTDLSTSADELVEAWRPLAARFAALAAARQPV
jgi:GMP synthase (glutamine-hydrolysing)